MHERRNGADQPATSDRVWPCTRCRAKLGYISADLRSVRLKRHDFMATVVDFKVLTVQCYRCAAYNELLDTSVDPLTALERRPPGTPPVAGLVVPPESGGPE